MKWRGLGSLNRKVGLDLGTATTRIWTDQEGLVLEEPTCLALDEQTGKVIAVGSEALEMVGRVRSPIKVHFPIQDSIIKDFELIVAMVKVLLRRVFQVPYFFRPVMMVNLPSIATAANRAALVELLYTVGAREVYTINQSLAAAIGAGVPIADASGTFVMVLGKGSGEVAIISLGSVVLREATTGAGQQLDQGIKQAIKEQANLVISDQIAEKLKQQLGSVAEGFQAEMLVSGRDVTSGAPKELMVNSAVIQAPLLKCAERFERVIQKVLSAIPPELTVDVIDKGMLLAGGLSQLHGLDAHLIKKLGIPVSVVDDPSRAAIRGVQAALENVELFKESLGYQR